MLKPSELFFGLFVFACVFLLAYLIHLGQPFQA